MKRFEIAVILGIVLSICTAYFLDSEQRQLADSVLRLHVIANSNSQFDQMVKLKVRDRILKESTAFSDVNNIEDLKAVIGEHTTEISALAQDELEQYGCNDPVAVLLGESYFPTKKYDTVSFPAGNYQALKVVIGGGKGENWWCVCFPPLCAGSAMGSSTQICEKGGMDEKNIRLICAEEEKDTPYVVKFKLMEWFGQAKEYITGK